MLETVVLEVDKYLACRKVEVDRSDHLGVLGAEDLDVEVFVSHGGHRRRGLLSYPQEIRKRFK